MKIVVAMAAALLMGGAAFAQSADVPTGIAPGINAPGATEPGAGTPSESEPGVNGPSENAPDGQFGQRTTVGIGMMCNTPDQAKQFVELQSKGTEAERAMDTVNASAGEGHACGVAAVAFVPSDTLDTKPVQNKLMKVVRIQVIANFDGGNWRQVDATQYAVVEDTSGETI